jgi:glycosidase
LRERLRLLYGAEAGERAYHELRQLLKLHRDRLPAVGAGGQLFDERDVVLITYADTFQAQDVKPLQVLSELARKRFEGLVSTIHLLPFFPYSSDYGFSVIDYERVDPALGDWDDVAELHRDFKLVFDFVLNHVSAESEWFRSFLRGEPPYDRFFITLDPSADVSGVTRPRTTPLLTPVETAAGRRWVWTTFGADQVDLDYSNPDVLVAMVDVLLTYVERGADLLRLDAVGYLWKQLGTRSIHRPQTHEVVKLFRDVLDAVAPRVALVTETNVPQAENVSYFGNGEDEAQMVYQFPLAPLVLDAFARADATTLSEWTAAQKTPSERTAFFNFLASHDGVGVVPARGILSVERIDALVRQVKRHGGEVSYKAEAGGGEAPYELNCTFFDALSDPRSNESWEHKRDRFLCSQAIMLALKGVPGVYAHSLFGSHNDHDAYARSGWKRDLNHGHIDVDELDEELRGTATEAAQIFDGMTRLLRDRAAEPAFNPNAPQEVLDCGRAVFALRRGPFAGRTVTALHNVSDLPQTVDGRTLGPYEVAWIET